MTRKTILVAGALGVVGRAVCEAAEHIGADVIGLSRRPPDTESATRFLSLDLADASACDAMGPQLRDVTHVVFTAYTPRETPGAEVVPNLAMLRHLMTTLQRASPALEHVTLLQGAKAYGSHLGPFRTPARESDPRHIPPNFYYDQEDFLAGLQRGAGWHWTIFRPTTVYGFSLASSMNLTMVIAVYATISRALGLPMRFPGTALAYQVIRQGVDAGLLAEAILWAGGNDSARNQTFNITNGDVYRWSGMWPHLATRLGMPVDEPQRIPLAEFMGDKAPLWSRIVERHGLRDFPYRDLVSWPFGTANFDREYDHILDSTKLRAAGFVGFRDSYVMFERQIAWLREQRIIPA